MAKRIIFRDARGRFVKYEDRYKAKVKSVQLFRRDEEGEKRYITVAKGGQMTPTRLATITTRTEFESLPEARGKAREFTSNKKYKAWDIAEQIDSTKGMRRHLLRITINLRDGKRLKPVTMYHIIKGNKKLSYQLFSRINDAIGAAGMNLYTRVGGRILPDRKGKTVKLESVTVEKVL